MLRRLLEDSFGKITPKVFLESPKNELTRMFSGKVVVKEFCRCDCYQKVDSKKKRKLIKSCRDILLVAKKKELKKIKNKTNKLLPRLKSPIN